MSSRYKQLHGPPIPQGGLKSPFLEEELFVGEDKAEWEPRLARLEAESPFQRAFEESRRTIVTPELYEEETGEEGDTLLAENFRGLQDVEFPVAEELLGEPYAAGEEFSFVEGRAEEAAEEELGGGNTYFRVANDITGAFEGGKPDTLNLKDKGIISYGKHQATLASGSLFFLLKRYAELSSSETAQRLASYLERVKKRDESLRETKAFIQLLKEAAREPEMSQAQDEVFTKEYWEPAKKAAAATGIKSALGHVIFYDTRVQGGLSQVIKQTLKRLGGKVGDLVRGHRITEQEFLRFFIEERIKRTLRISARQSAEAKTLYEEAQALERVAKTAEPERGKKLLRQATEKRRKADRTAANAKALERSAKKTRGPTFKALVDSGDLELRGDANGQIHLVGKPGVTIRGLQPGATVDEPRGKGSPDGIINRPISWIFTN